MNIKLRYRDPHGTPVEAKAIELNDPEPALRPPLAAQRLRLELPDHVCDVRCVRPVADGPGGLAAGYRQLDNEILAGMRLARLSAAGDGYPPELSRLIGYEADSAEPFALLEPLRGTAAGEFAGTMLTDQRRRFQVSLLRAVRWLTAAGIAHRGLSPDSVRWDGQHVQITDFSQATLVGVPRSAAGVPPWQPPEQRAGQISGEIGPADDMWAVGRLIFHMVTGDELDDTAKLHDIPDLVELLDGIIGPPERRPSAQQLLQRLSAADVPPRPLATDPVFVRGRAEFFVQRRRKHPETAPPAEDAASPEAVPEPPVRRVDPVGPVGARWRWAVVAVLVALALLLVLGR